MEEACSISELCSCGSGMPHSECCAGGNPADMLMGMWKDSFFQAMNEVHTEVLKEKIKAAWGDKLDKYADQVLEAMGDHWEGALKQYQGERKLQSIVDSCLTEECATK